MGPRPRYCRSLSYRCSHWLMRSANWFNLSILLISLLFYAANRFSRLFTSIPHLASFFRFHFNDYLGAIVFIAYLNLLLVAGKRSVCVRFPLLLIWAGVLSLMWEGVAPLILPYSTADWLDCLAYFLGVTTYWLLWRLYQKHHLHKQRGGP